MTPKGRIIIIRGNDTDIYKAEYESTSYQLLIKAFTLLSEQKNVRIEIITTSNLAANKKEMYSTALEKQGYNNVGFIYIQKKQDTDHYYPRIRDAKSVVFVDNNLKICEILKNSVMLELLSKRYQHEESFTIAGINSGAMYLSELIISNTGDTAAGLGFIKNCIIDTQFIHGARFKSLVKTVLGHQEYVGLALRSGMLLIIEKGYKASCFGSHSIIAVNAKNIKNVHLTRGTSVYKKNLKGHILTDGSVLNLISGDPIKNHLPAYSLNFTNRNIIL
ncbi:hypothetical protein [Chryseobacterium sp. Bi04]|uniref:hypothetical protein n=1 Tax=Chryseobacterium sp. Bi04 TaxID=2822345 RepID=UPI001E1A29B7|nr:hypothetical protein [Chryseobacterium sp. Bi04]CAH0290139.1 Cyanophycinase [Chryseobacterium sp. Bi04]